MKKKAPLRESFFRLDEKLMYGEWHRDFKLWAMWSYDKTDEYVQTKKIDQSDETSSSSRLLLVQ